MRKIGHGAVDPAADPLAAGQGPRRAVLFDGRDLLGLSRKGDAPRPRQGHRDDLPGADDLASIPSTPSATRSSRRSRCISSVSTREAYEIAEQALRDVGIADPAPAAERISAPDVRRHAAARHDRDGAVVQAQAADRRRADDRAGRDDSGPDPRTAAQASARDAACRSC